MDLRPTKKRIIYSLLISLPISLIFFVFYFEVNKKNYLGPLLSPEGFNLVYIAPIIAFLTSYFFVSWLILHKEKTPLMRI